MDEKALRERYRRLMERRGTGGGPSVALETLEALAEDRLSGPERVAALDAVYADPAARAEFEFLRELARERPRTADRRRFWLATAAALVAAAAAGLIWRASSVPPEPLRGSDADVVLVAPAVAATLTVGDTLAWHPAKGAQGYTVEVVTDDGEVAFRAETTDTLAVFARPASGTVQGAAQWWVTANLGGTASVRSAPRRITLAP